jgi:hypothetical protein
MKDQLNLFTGQQLRDIGIKKSFDSANDKYENWGEMAYDFLLHFLRTNQAFLTEDVRIASTDIVPDPPSKRAWGAVILKAKREGLVRRIGFRNVKNPKAHCTPAALWKKV